MKISLRILTLWAIAWAVACGPQVENDVAVGTLERDRIELISEQQEPVVAIHVMEGQRVATDELLIELDDRRFAARLEAAKSVRDLAVAVHAELVRGARSETISEAKARVAEAEAAVGDVKHELERVRALVSSKVSPQRQLDQAKASFDAAVARRDAQRAALESLLNGTTVEELHQAEARLAEAEANLLALELDADRLKIRAPRPGRVETLPYEVGEEPSRGTVVAVLLADTAPYARVHVSTPIRPRIEPGSAATVRVTGVEGSFAGRVRTVASEADFTPFYALTENDRGRLSYLAEIDLIEPRAAELPTGLPVEAVFEHD